MTSFLFQSGTHIVSLSVVKFSRHAKVLYLAPAGPPPQFLFPPFFSQWAPSDSWLALIFILFLACFLFSIFVVVDSAVQLGSHIDCLFFLFPSFLDLRCQECGRSLTRGVLVRSFGMLNEWRRWIDMVSESMPLYFGLTLNFATSQFTAPFSHLCFFSSTF